MRHFKRWTAVILALCMISNRIPLSISAEDLTEEPQLTAELSESVQDDIVADYEIEQDSESIGDGEPETEMVSEEEPEDYEEENYMLLELRLLSEETDTVQFTDPFANQFSLVLIDAGFNPSQIISETDAGVTLTIDEGQAGILELLSQQTQTAEANYQDWNIAFSFTGYLTLSDQFQGLGDNDFPFQGKFTDQNITIKTSRTIFKALGVQADLHGVQIDWTGTPDKPVLTENLIADENAHDINMPLAKAAYFSPYIGRLTGGDGAVILPSLNYSEAKESPGQEIYQGDVGLICGSMEDNTKLNIDVVSLPDGIVDFRASGNVGGLIGSMGENTELLICQNMILNTRLSGKNAGGLVGSVTNGVINFADDIRIEITTELTAAGDSTDGSAGGIAGVIHTVTGPLGENANVILNSVKANGESNSGGYYGNCTAAGQFKPLEGAGTAEDAVIEVSGSGSCGGVFGTLQLESDGKCILETTGNQPFVVSSFLKNAADATAYGGVAGNLSGDTRANALIVANCNIISNVSVGNDTSKYPKYHGGITAKQNTATLDAKNSTVTAKNPTTKTASDYGFGGLSAYVVDGAILIADTMAVITDSYSNNPGGGGVAGSVHKGSIVYLKNSLDLSRCLLTTNNTSGQIVGAQDCSLVYAPGVTITRLQTGSLNGLELDDIGNYGELYRIAGFLSVDVNNGYEVTFGQTLSKTGEEYLLSNGLDYACLALAWQARGYFPTVAGITESSWDELKSCKIALNDDLDLTNCGIGGLTRDVNSGDDTFSGEFDGKGHKITLDIGAENQANSTKVPKGDGRIYWHNATGLFAVLSSGAKVQNLTLAGSLRISNSRLAMYTGALAARLLCNVENGDPIQGVSTKISVDVIGSGGSQMYLGGLFGNVYSTGKTTLKLDSKLSAIITVDNSGNGSYNHAGGAIGAIAAESNVTIQCDNATLGGKIEYKKEVNNLYAGGLVGTIYPGDSVKRNIEITNLTVNGFSLKGNARDRMGGILGGIWADTDVTVERLIVSNASLTASGAAALGGLVYRASGKWTVSGADLSGLTINASSAQALGVLVCKGGSYKEPINSTGSNYDVNGLYLEMTEHWEWSSEKKKGYNIPSSITFGSGVFDEFVAYTACADRDSDTPDYQITASGSGIISLKTANGTVDMKEGERNTYRNRTDAGQSRQTNPYSRYYYNLPEVMAQCNGNGIDTANELLIWSVYRYAASNLKEYFQSEKVNVENETIGGTSEGSRADFDMEGLSYYPVSITNADVIVQYADVTFYNSQIEEKEDGNKSTREEAKNHSQHYTMHCGLFLNFTADIRNAEMYENRTMTVNGVSFAGSVGVVSGGSGALICGTVKGDTQAGNSSICTVVLADEDSSEKAVSFNGLSVEPAGNYTPVLINQIGSYAGLKANYVTTTDQQTMTAGSSLIGDVGGQGASAVSLEFAGTIKLSESDVFTQAILLNSLRYENGSATYRFNKSKDYGEGSYLHNVTYGRELSTTVEYAGKQGCYYDGYGEGYYVSANSSFDSQNDFSAYLPYVAFSPAASGTTHPLAEGWHELAVNVRSINLTVGCGTYGHPYQVDASLLKEAANYINTGTASDGWQVRVSAAAETYHTSEGECDVLLTYTDNGWKAGDEIYDGDVQQYLANAYYEITEDIELSDFNGIGTDGSGQGLPFTGVIKGKETDGRFPTIILSGGSASFIKYSYGSVVRDLTVELNQTPTLNRESWTRGTAEQTPKTFFGGVIGCVLGGDNIIENVAVSAGDAFNVTLTGDKTYLVPVGGYIGVIAGGGVIFRGTYSNSTGVGGTDKQLYRNPYIGRVLGGYAFYEGTGTAPDNGDKNYKINKITSSTSPDLNWDGSKVTVNGAQGLLVFSAIVSSGAGSKSSNAYVKGRARNAFYDQIGAATEPDDYITARKDAGAVWSESNTPYLLSRYAGYTGSAEICSSGTDGISIEFKGNADFDMGGCGNGYRGLSARYVSNAVFGISSGTPNVVDASRVVLRVSSFDGKNTNVQNISMNVEEYADDDFHAASLGGIFNIVWTKKQSGGTTDSTFAQNLTLTKCKVSLQYINSNGDEQTQADTKTFSDSDGLSCVAVGGFTGSVSDVDVTAKKNDKTSNYLFSNIHIKGGEINGPNSAGGLIGASAMTSSYVDGYPGCLLSNKKDTIFGPNFLNCSYSGIAVTAELVAGGLIGEAYANGSGTKPQFSSLGFSYNGGSFSCYTSCTVTEEGITVGSESTITAKACHSIAAGIFGAAGMRVGVNNPAVNNETNLTVLNTNTSVQPVCLTNVMICSSMEDYYIMQSDGSYNAPDNYVNRAFAGGVIGRIGSVNPACFYDINLDTCPIKTINASGAYAGGIVGSGYTNTSIIIERCKVLKTEIDSKRTGGFVGYGYDRNSFNLHMRDCKLEGGTVKGGTNAGGLVGDAAGQYYLFNILIKNTSITGSGAGRLFGNMDTTDNKFKVYAAGISICATDSSVQIPDKMGSSSTYVGYIAYADYAGTETPVDGETDPYVTTNPNYILEGADKKLTGDAVGKIPDDTYASVAARIWADQKIGAADKKNLVSYPEAAVIVNTEGKTEPVVSTFLAEQGCGPELPVLVLGGSDASVIEDYLNVITNGGYGVSEVSLEEPKVYYYDKDTKSFSLATEAQLKKEPRSIYLSGNTPRVSGNQYDNTRNRFTLIDANFTVKVDGSDCTYTVSIPVIVKRELQYNFMSTFSYGAEFCASTYDNLKTHVLESTDNPVTAYLTYQYNREKTDYVEYDWQSYMDDGGDMMGLDKILSFSSGLPSGTQLLLVDCQDGNRAYRYQTQGTSAGTRTDIRLSDFTSVTEGISEFRASMADILGVTVSSNDAGGKYVETDASSATVRLKHVYYRPVKEGETVPEGTKRFDLTIPDLEKEENLPEENYYLVVNVPDQGEGFYINGALSSSLRWNMPNHGTWVHRYDKGKVCTGSNDESTYQISSGYRQALTSLSKSGAIDLLDENRSMKVQVQDIITFSNRQVYGDNDQLFLKFAAELQEHTLQNGSSETVQGLGFPSGTTGIVHFFVQDDAGNYYAYNGDSWVNRGSTEAEAVSYTWVSQGADMELPLSGDGEHALDLAGVRKMIKGQNTTGESHIIIRAEMDIVFGGQEMVNSVVPPSENSGTDRWVQLHYTGRISTGESSLAYSIVSASAEDNARYYRGVQYAAILSMDARNISQLGINPLELVPDYLTNDQKASRIDIMASLNLAKLASPENIREVLSQTESISFTLSLQRGGRGGYTDISGSAQDFITFDRGMSWVIPQSEYYDSTRDQLITGDIFDGTEFTIPITAYVNVKQRNFANYRINLKVQFNSTSDRAVSVTDTDAYLIYTFACIKPEFFDPSGQAG